MKIPGLALSYSKKFGALISVLCFALQGQLAIAQPGTISVHVDKPGAAISPTMFGIFFEDI